MQVSLKVAQKQKQKSDNTYTVTEQVWSDCGFDALGSMNIKTGTFTINGTIEYNKVFLFFFTLTEATRQLSG